MEEHQQVTVELLGDQKVLHLSDFRQLSPMVQLTDLQEICKSVLSEQKVHILHALLYYIISVEKGLNFSAYRETILQAISEYYIKNKMHIDQFQFSTLCSKILGLPIEECLHIIYYLVYNKLASAAYVHSICFQQDYREKKKFLQDCSSKNFNRRNDQLHAKKLKTIQAKKDSSLHDSHDIDQFASELNDKLRLNNPQEKYSRRSKKFEKDKKVSISKPTMMDKEQPLKVYGFLPRRISSDENSSVIRNILKSREQYTENQNWKKTDPLRKQKFNENYRAYLVNRLSFRPNNCESCKYLYSNAGHRREDRQHKNAMKSSLCYYKDIKNKLQTYTVDLDKVRIFCEEEKKQVSQPQPQNKDKDKDKDTPLHAINRSMNKTCGTTFNQKHCKNTQPLDSRNDSIHSEAEEDDIKVNYDVIENLLRKNNTKNSVMDGPKKGKGKENWLLRYKVDSKNQIQRYKKEYKEFMNNKIFEKLEEI